MHAGVISSHLQNRDAEYILPKGVMDKGMYECGGSIFATRHELEGGVVTVGHCHCV